jgi:hypothetical protein
MERTLSTITQLPATKQQIQIYVEGAKAEIMAGNESSLLIWRQLKAFQEVIKQLLEDTDIKRSVISEAEKHPEKTFELHNCKFNIRGTTTYDYSTCGDPELKQLEQEMALVKSKIDAKKSFLKGLKESYSDRETGEMIYPAASSYTETVVVTLK